MRSRNVPRIYYYTPDHNVPSWGIGMLHNHVRLLRRNGMDAFVLHDRHPFRISWYRSRVPRIYLDTKGFRPEPRDILVVPEVVASRKRLQRFRCRRVVFVQGSSLITLGLAPDWTYESLGYESAIAVMPHVKEILERHFSIATVCVPPCIAPYFYVDREHLEDRPRKRTIVLFPKRGYDDYHTLARVLHDRLEPEGWDLVEIVGKSHRQVARLFRGAAFHVNVNSQESLNATVAEAMAAGCIPICYDAYGGLDYLAAGVNAYVLPNRHVFPLIDKVLDLTGRYDAIQNELASVRRQGIETAYTYTEEVTEKALLDCYRELLG
jgi:hypothetical protein